MDEEKPVFLTGRGTALLTFFTDEKDAKKVRYYKMLFLQIAEKSGMTQTKFNEYAKQALRPMLSFHAAILQYLGDDKERITGFVRWLWDEKYLTDADIMGVFNAKVIDTPVQSENFKPCGNLDELKKKQPIWVQVTGTSDNDGFLVPLSLRGQQFTYPDAMTIDEAISCVDWLIERHSLPWDAVFIPVNDVVKQANKSLTCRRALKMVQAEGLSIR